MYSMSLWVFCIYNRGNKNNFAINNNIKKEYRNSEIFRPTSSSILECIATRSKRVVVADSKGVSQGDREHW